MSTFLQFTFLWAKRRKMWMGWINKAQVICWCFTLAKDLIFITSTLQDLCHQKNKHAIFIQDPLVRYPSNAISQVQQQHIPHRNSNTCKSSLIWSHSRCNNGHQAPTQTLKPLHPETEPSICAPSQIHNSLWSTWSPTWRSQRVPTASQTFIARPLKV